MAKFSSISLNGSESLEELVDAVAKLQKQLQFMMDRNIDSRNIREVGGWLVGPNYFKSRDGIVGISSFSSEIDNVRYWSGHATPELAPFRVYHSGKLSTSNIEILGGTISWGSVGAPSAAQVGALPFNDPKISQLNSVGTYLGMLGESQVTGLPAKVSNLSAIGDYIGAMSMGQVTGLSPRMTNITSTGVYTGTVGTDQLVAGTALIGVGLIENLIVGTNVTMGPSATISWAQVSGKDLDYSNITGTKPASNADNTAAQLIGSGFTKIGPNYIYTGNLSADQMTTGTININTSATIGNSLTLGNQSGALSGKYIHFNSGAYISNALDEWGGYTALNISASRIDMRSGYTLLGSGSYMREDGSDRLLATRDWVQNNSYAKFR